VRDVLFHFPLPPSAQFQEVPGIGEVHLYRNLEVLPRAYVPPLVRSVASPEAALRQVASAEFRPHEEALVEGPAMFLQEPAPLTIGTTSPTASRSRGCARGAG